MTIKYFVTINSRLFDNYGTMFFSENYVGIFGLYFLVNNPELFFITFHIIFNVRRIHDSTKMFQIVFLVVHKTTCLKSAKFVITTKNIQLQKLRSIEKIHC